MGPIASRADLISALVRRRWLIVLILALGIPAALVFAAIQPRLYEATAVIQIEAPEIAPPLMGQAQSMPVVQDNQIDLIQQQMLSRDNIMALIIRFDLFPQAPSLTERVALVRGAVTITKLIDPALAWRTDVRPSGLAVQVRLDDPQRAADLANAFVDGIVAEAQARTEGRTSRTLAFLLAEEERTGAEIAALEAEIARFREANLDSLPEGLTAQRDRLARLTDQSIAIEREVIALSGNSERLRAEDVTRQTELLQGQLSLLSQNIATLEAAIAAAPAVEQQLNSLTRELASQVAEQAVITARRTEAEMSQTLEQQDQAARYEVLETAIAPEFAVSTSRRKLALAGIVAVTGLAFGLALALEVMNPVLRTSVQLRKELGVEPVIVVPVLRNAGRTRQDRRRRGIGLGIVAVLTALGTLLGPRLLGLFTGQQRAAVPVRASRRRQ